MSLRIAIRAVVFLILFNALLLAQNSSEHEAMPGTAAAQASQSSPPPSPSKPSNEFAQMRDDLNKMESLNLNMSSEVEFLHDQNLQILLRTNSQMWTLLIRDLQRQLARQEREATTSPAVVKK